MFANSNRATRNDSLKWFAAVWAVAVLAPLVYFPGASVLIGHPWKVELVASFILFAASASGLIFRQKVTSLFAVAPAIARRVIVPVCAFTAWSAASIFWADSAASVVHHTLLWCGYLVFFLFALRVVADNRLFKTSIVALGAVAGIICLCCVFEYVFAASVGETFGTRYARYAEIFAALLPLFLSFALRLKGKLLWLSASVTGFLWLALLFAMSRGAFFSSIIGLFVFFLLRTFSVKNSTEKKRLFFAAAGLICIVWLTQVSLFSAGGEQSGGTISRVAAVQNDKDSSNSLGQNVRFLFAGVGKEMFFDRYFLGVGADNFGLEFNRYRRVYSANTANAGNAAQQEHLLPERAHNEYLQILTELGLVGAAIFLWFLGGIAKSGFAEIVKNRAARSSILTHAALAGIAAFLVSSCFSSFSFRLMQNGLVFFFLLAILLRNYATTKNREKSVDAPAAPALNLIFASVAIVACLSLTVFSALKATSQYFVYQAEKQENFEAAKSYYETAILLDSANAAADFSYGLRFLSEGKYVESAALLRRSVDKGLNDSVSYSYLISAQTLANQSPEAIETASRAVEIFPYSTFLRVRYASLLEKFNQTEQAANQQRIAENLDKRKAAAWRLLINEGSLKASAEARINKNVTGLDELAPASGVYAVLAERDIVFPNEKSKFKF